MNSDWLQHYNSTKNSTVFLWPWGKIGPTLTANLRKFYFCKKLTTPHERCLKLVTAQRKARWMKWPRCLPLSFRWSPTCHSHFPLASVWKTKCMRRGQAQRLSIVNILNHFWFNVLNWKLKVEINQPENIISIRSLKY